MADYSTWTLEELKRRLDELSVFCNGVQVQGAAIPAELAAECSELEAEVRRRASHKDSPLASGGLRRMLELVYDEDGREHVFPLEKPEVVLGRSLEADLTLASMAVSRRHARIAQQPEGFFVEDLHSRNRTKVNDLYVERALVTPGDRITLGNFELRLRERTPTAEESVVLDDNASLPPATNTVVRSAREFERVLEGQRAVAEAPAVPGEIERSREVVRVLLHVARAVISEDSLDGLLQKVMELVFEHTSAQRGMLGLYEGEQLVPRVVRYSMAPPGLDQMVIPKAITAKVKADKVAILTTDAQRDFDGSVSAYALGVRGAMCVPLWDKDKVVGIVYVDGDRRAGGFDEETLELLGALANYAAVAIQRQSLSDRIEQEQATRARLERYHARGVVERILRSGAALDALEMQEQQVSVSFTDMVGFTALAEGLEPREVGMAINEFFTELTECVFRCEGTLDKYMGDCIMAVFGAPETQPDHAVRAVRTALDMQRTVERLNRDRGDRPQIQLRTGINSGRVVAGDFGSPKRKDYSVLGDTVNLASRLEAYVAQPGWVVIGEATYEDIKDHFECESLGEHELKGRRRQTRAYRVLGEKAAP